MSTLLPTPLGALRPNRTADVDHQTQGAGPPRPARAGAEEERASPLVDGTAGPACDAGRRRPSHSRADLGDRRVRRPDVRGAVWPPSRIAAASAARARGRAVAWPASTDFAGWVEVVAQAGLGGCPPGLAVGALRANFVGGDRRTVDALASHVAKSINKLLRRVIGRNHPNAGEDIIERAAGALLGSIFDPLSTDGDDLVVAFATRVRYRGIDAVRAEVIHHARTTDLGTDDDGEACLPDGRPLNGDGGSAAVAHVISRIADPMQRLAFQLHMEGMRTYCGDPCIASVCGCHPKTAARWIANAKRRLAAEF